MSYGLMIALQDMERISFPPLPEKDTVLHNMDMLVLY